MPTNQNRQFGFQSNYVSYKALIIAAICYSLVFLIYTRPLISYFTDGFISPPQHGDSPVFVWNVHSFYETVIHNNNPFYSYSQLYPIGGDLIMHSNLLIIGLVNLLVNNPILSINLMLYLSFVLSGIGALILCYKHCQSFGWSLVAGFIFAFCPYKL